MGAGASSKPISIFDYSYQKERSELRKALILTFIDNPENKTILSKISAVRSIIIQNADICQTAAREAEHEFEYSPTSLEAAYVELERLFTIYETSTILKSVQCRISPVACPLGHYAPYFDQLLPQTSTSKKNKKNLSLCGICDKTVTNGHQCAYCVYNLCVPCSTIYCCNGHAMKLWTHPEAEHWCVVCNVQPITAGYRCTVCTANDGQDYDICDMCTNKKGRKAVQQVILDRMAGEMKYLEDHITESETANRTVKTHKKKVAENSYPTTLQLYEFSQTMNDLKIIAEAEVRQTRITKEVIRLRGIITEGIQHSATAYRESIRTDNYTVHEIDRLNILVEMSHRERSPQVRKTGIVACPLGHVCYHFKDRPAQYIKRGAMTTSMEEINKLADAKLSTAVTGSGTEEDKVTSSIVYQGQKAKPKKKPKKKDPSNPYGHIENKNTAICKICERLAAPEGYHCDFCEYDLCSTCAVVFCTKGHPMIMWSEPQSIVPCSRCSTLNITSGYCCNVCDFNVCDLCTAKEGRNNIRNVWETEMNELLSFMKANKRLSDIAQYYHWRHANYIVSIGLLCEYVMELREAKVRAEMQIKQKDIIDLIKDLRSQVTVNLDLCATANREANKSVEYLFPTRKKASQEAIRLQGLLDQSTVLQSTQNRKAAGIACPLAHAAFLIDPSTLTHEKNKNPVSETVLLTIKNDTTNPTKSSYNRDGFDGQLLLTNEEGNPSNETKNAWSAFETPVKNKDSEKVEPVPVETPNPEKWSLISSPVKSMVPNTFTADILRNTEIDITLHSFNDKYEKPDEESGLYGDVYSDAVLRACRICGTHDLYDGHCCSYCEYDLCCDCSSVYCREAHKLKIWTMPDAVSLSCNLCRVVGIQTGYRCVECNIDICDMCTTRDSRNAFMFWPRKEINKIVMELESLQDDSPMIADYLVQYKQKKINMDSMSRLCKQLKEIQQVKIEAQEDLKQRKANALAARYGMYNNDM